MPPIDSLMKIPAQKARPIGTFVVTKIPSADWLRTERWIEKITAHTEHGAEVRSRWCEAISDRKAYLIATALNNVAQQREETLMTQGER